MCPQEESLGPQDLELRELKESLQDTQPVGVLVDGCKTLDQVGVMTQLLAFIFFRFCAALVCSCELHSGGSSLHRVGR